VKFLFSSVDAKDDAIVTDAIRAAEKDEEVFGADASCPGVERRRWVEGVEVGVRFAHGGVWTPGARDHAR